MRPRYAAYLAPAAGTPLHAAARNWLGRDPILAESCARSAAGLGEDEHAALTESPRHYGFHGTLKAPIALADEAREADLVALLRDVAARHERFRLPLRIGRIGAFFALVPTEKDARLDALAADCVATLDPLRRPPDDADLARRRRSGLTARQEDNLMRWGYPYVFDAFRFHMTLTGQVTETGRQRVAAALEAHFGAVVREPLLVDRVSIFYQPDRSAPFVERAAVMLKAPGHREPMEQACTT